jgi:diguanylate cyclase (GGDEF)-like protein
MDTRASALAHALGPAVPGVEPVAVTRWSARLAEAQCERDYRLSRFTTDLHRAFLLLALMPIVGCLNLLVELDAYGHGASRFVALIPPAASIVLPLLALAVALQVRTPRMLETLMVVCAAVGLTSRMVMLSLHPALGQTWPTLIVGAVFVIYLYLPLRLMLSLALAATFSVVAPLWWSHALGESLTADYLYRCLVWLLAANALGFAAANGLHRSLRAQFAQSLVLQQLLSTDALTGIANRRRFDAALEREWRRCERASAPLSLLMIDVDHFKAYNDHWGHQQGDDCLRLVARLLLNSAGRPGDLVARYGGEEFVCLLPEVGPEGARAVAARLMAAVARANVPHPRSPTSLWVTVSIGSATATDFSEGPHALIALADQLLYAAKNAGRDRIVEGELKRGARATGAAA